MQPPPRGLVPSDVLLELFRRRLLLSLLLRWLLQLFLPEIIRLVDINVWEYQVRLTSPGVVYKDLVIVGGYNVYPREIDEVLYQHPDVAEVAAFGQPDDFYARSSWRWSCCGRARVPRRTT